MGYKTYTFIGLDFPVVLKEQPIAWLTQRLARDNNPIFSDSYLKALIFAAQPSAIRFAGQSRAVILIVLFSISRFFSVPILKNLGFSLIFACFQLVGNHCKGIVLDWLNFT